MEPITWGARLFPGLEHWMVANGIDPHAAIDATIVTGLLIVFAFIAGRRFRSSDMVEPEGKVSLAFFAEFAIGGLLKFFDSIMEHGSRKLFFFLGTFAFFILGNNLIGLIPGFNPPTDQYNVTITLALMTFLTAHFIGIKKHGLHYITKFFGPVWWLAPVMFPIEIISHLARPLSLSMRLFGNMTGDHKALSIFLGFGIWLLPAVFYGLGTFVSFMQTFVFVLLAAVYFDDALAEAH